MPKSHRFLATCTTYHFISYDFISCHIISFHVISFQISSTKKQRELEAALPRNCYRHHWHLHGPRAWKAPRPSHEVHQIFKRGVTVSDNPPGQTIVMSMGMDVSENNATPKSSILIGFSIINHPFWGTTIFGNTHKKLNVTMMLLSFHDMQADSDPKHPPLNLASEV